MHLTNDIPSLSTTSLLPITINRDAYIVAAGHEGQTGPSDATLRVVEFGLEMLEKVKTIRPPSGMQLQIRVGIHTGPAYSGVVGTKVPKYSFFGDSECWSL